MKGLGIFLAVALVLTPFIVTSEGVTPPFEVFVNEADGPGILIWSVIPDGYNRTETIVIKNVGGTSIDLEGWSLTDREGSRTFGPRILIPDEELVISE